MGIFLSSQNARDNTGACDDYETSDDTEASDDYETSDDTVACDDTGASDDTEASDDNEDEKDTLSLLLMGKTGHGKSSLGNCILGYKTFKVGNDTTSQTADVECGYSDFESCSLKVVDGPGLEDTKLSKLEGIQTAQLNMSIALTMCSTGVDAFLFVFSFGSRFTEDEVSVLENLKVIFGQYYLKHAIVVLTYGDNFNEKEITFDDWCKKQIGPFRQLYEACDGRCVLFNNKEMDKEKQMEQRKQLTELAYDLKRRHKSYTADCFKRAESERQRLIITLKHPILKEEIQKQAGILTSKIEKYCQHPSAKLMAVIERAIRKLKNKITTEDKDHGLLDDLMRTVEIVERNLHDTVELCKLSARLENTRKAALIWPNVSKFCYSAGGVLSVIHPDKRRLIKYGCRAIDAVGAGIITYVEHATEAKINNIKSKMSTSVPRIKCYIKH